MSSPSAHPAAYPLDGGRILNEFLEPRIGYYRRLFWIGLSGTIFAVIAKRSCPSSH